jgi:D-arabinose 1-dehydrogenase
MILEALRTLHEFQKKGQILKIGIAGYSLPLLLRLAKLAKAHSVPLDIIQTFAHQSIQNRSLQLGYLSAFEKEGNVGIVTNAAPLAMGILTSGGGPEWHPVNEEDGDLKRALREVVGYCEEKGTKLEIVASEFGYKKLNMGNGREVPVVIGCKNVEEVERALKSWHVARGTGEKVDEEVVKGCIEIFEKHGVEDWSWENGAKMPEEGE